MALSYVEPGRTIFLHEDVAITEAKKYAAEMGFSYVDDGEALRDFAETHWAIPVRGDIQVTSENGNTIFKIRANLWREE